MDWLAADDEMQDLAEFAEALHLKLAFAKAPLLQNEEGLRALEASAKSLKSHTLRNQFKPKFLYLLQQKLIHDYLENDDAHLSATVQIQTIFKHLSPYSIYQIVESDLMELLQMTLQRKIVSEEEEEEEEEKVLSIAPTFSCPSIEVF
jgi:hypothetical protein